MTMMKTHLEASLRINRSIMQVYKTQLTASERAVQEEHTLEGMVTIDQAIDPRENKVYIDPKILEEFINSMNLADNPLVYNRRDDYVYNLLLLAVEKMKKEQSGIRG